MNYPKILLPQPHYKVISDISKIKYGILIHFTESKDNKTEDGRLKPEFVVRNYNKELRDYSNFLLGLFKKDHIYIEINNKSRNGYFVKLWENGYKVIVPEYEKDYRLNYSRGYFCLKVQDCMNANIYFESDEIVTCKVIHTPTNSNFWHFSLRWYYDGEDIESWKEKQRKGIQRRILTSAKAFVAQNAIFQTYDIPEWDKSLYTK